MKKITTIIFITLIIAGFFYLVPKVNAKDAGGEEGYAIDATKGGEEGFIKG